MKGLDELLGEEYGADGSGKLYLELADGDEQLLGQLIELRRQRMTQEQVAAKMGVTQATVSAFERIGNDPRMSTVRRYAAAIGVMIRHQPDPNPELCEESSYIAHVHSAGVDTTLTAAAITRKMRLETHWPGEDDALEDVASGRVHLGAGRSVAEPTR